MNSDLSEKVNVKQKVGDFSVGTFIIAHGDSLLVSDPCYDKIHGVVAC